MKIRIVGAGSIGGYLAVLLARAGHEVTVVARGAHLAAIRANGLRVPIEKRIGIAAVIRPRRQPAHVPLHAWEALRD